MKPRLVIIFLLIVITPLVLLAWVGVRAAKDEQRLVSERFRVVFEGQLADVETLIGKTVGEVERSLYSVSGKRVDGTDGLRDLVRGNRLVRQIFVRDPDGAFNHPPDWELRTEQELEFFDRTRSIWESGVRFGVRTDLGVDVLNSKVPLQYSQTYNLGDPGQRAGNNVAMAQQELAPLSDPASGWHSWFWGDGLNLLYWRQPFPGGAVFGIEVERMAFISDIVAALPTETGLGSGRVVLADARGQPVYQWGDYEQVKGEQPVAERALGAPLEMWRLRYFTGAGAGAGGGALGAGALTGLVGGLIAAGVALLGISIYFFREHAGEMRSASQKVSFVNQVSHELKTPLTNIRMYAELAADKLDDESDPELGKCLGVVSDESGRLGRLIGNVLTFSKRGRGATLRPGVGDVDEVVATTLDHFRPSLDKAGVEIEWAPGAGGSCSVDADALEQILANLFSNVEKYAASGKSLKVGSTRDSDRVEVVVEDRGPGVRKSDREKVFEPFARLSDTLTEGVSGTGIGLSIARDLARLHGGDLVLTDPDSGGGCRFVLTLLAPIA